MSGAGPIAAMAWNHSAHATARLVESHRSKTSVVNIYIWELIVWSVLNFVLKEISGLQLIDCSVRNFGVPVMA